MKYRLLVTQIALEWLDQNSSRLRKSIQHKSGHYQKCKCIFQLFQCKYFLCSPTEEVGSAVKLQKAKGISVVGVKAFAHSKPSGVQINLQV